MSGDKTSSYGDLMLLSPTGASDVTSKQDGLDYAGVKASQKMVETDYDDLFAMKSCYEQVGKAHSIEPALIAGLASRESRGGRLLKATKGYGDHGNAYGILQCDIRTSGLGADCTKYAWNSCEHMDMMVKRVLIDKIKGIQKKHPDWPKEKQLQGGVAAYNFGCKNVQTWKGVDVGTTGNDYSNDVIARAQHLKNHYNW